MIFWRYGNSLYFFLIILIVIASVFIFLLFTTKQEGFATQSNIPLEIFGLTYYELSEQNTSIEVHAKHAYRQIQDQNIQEYIIDLKATEQKNQGTKEQLYANAMIRTEQKLFFPQGVNFWKENTFFWSQQGQYEIQEQFFQGEGDFIIQPAMDNVIYGLNLSYDYTLGLSYAENIKAFLIGNTND